MENKSKKRILVTGGAGYIGSAIVKQLLEVGHDVTIFDDLSTGREDKIDSRAVFIRGSVTDISALAFVFGNDAFDVVIHCAAKKVMSESESNPGKYFENNVVGTLNILQCMEKYNVPKIIFSSTAAVYAPVKEARPVTEKDEVNPASVYGRSKLMAEMLITEYGRLKKIKSYIIFRYFNVAGDAGLLYQEPHAEAVFPILAKAIKDQITFNIYGTEYETRDGSAVRDYIHVLDLSYAHLLALSHNKSGVFNLGTSMGCTVYELIAQFESLLGKKVVLSTQKPRPGEVPVMLANADKAKAELGWQPSKSVKEMVESTVKVFNT